MTKTLLLLLAVVAVVLLVQRLLAGPGLNTGEAAARVQRGEAVFVDVRETPEQAGGVLEGAVLLPLSQLRGGSGAIDKVLGPHRGKELLVYCRSGARSAMALQILRAAGYRAVNAGGYGALGADLPVTKPGAP